MTQLVESSSRENSASVSSGAQILHVSTQQFWIKTTIFSFPIKLVVIEFE
ncbi:MAG TPA: hypothetical protein VGO33_02825 [Gemmatimonadaceae bacterium]|nr:hypothetical protein [Gemmatimonadaceae bacterium]